MQVKKEIITVLSVSAIEIIFNIVFGKVENKTSFALSSIVTSSLSLIISSFVPKEYNKLSTGLSLCSQILVKNFLFIPPSKIFGITSLNLGKVFNILYAYGKDFVSDKIMNFLSTNDINTPLENMLTSVTDQWDYFKINYLDNNNTTNHNLDIFTPEAPL